jgi:hypothetical protein
MARHYLSRMAFQVHIEAEGFGALPAFADRKQAISYAKGLLAQLPDDADPSTTVIVRDTEGGEIIFNYTLVAWRWAVMAIGERAYCTVALPL